MHKVFWNRFSWEINKYSKIVRWKITSVHAGMGDTAYEKQREREGGKESRVTWGSEGDYSMWRQHHRGNRARGMKEIKVWPTERVAASQWGQTLLATALIGATKVTYSDLYLCCLFTTTGMTKSEKSQQGGLENELSTHNITITSRNLFECNQKMQN